MAIRNIVKDGDPVLHKICRPVDEITPRIITLLDDLVDTLHEANGAGLAEPQVGVLRRVVVVEVADGDLYEMINPEIIERSEERQQEVEGCLSIPGEWGVTDRPMTVTIRATDRAGKVYEATGCGLLARAFCHELFHFDFFLFTYNAVRMLTEDEIDNLQ